MAVMKFSVSYKDTGFTQEEVLSRLQKAILKRQDLFQKYHIEEFSGEWNGFEMDFLIKAMGYRLSGKLVVREECVETTVDLAVFGLFSPFFRGLIEKELSAIFEEIFKDCIKNE